MGTGPSSFAPPVSDPCFAWGKVFAEIAAAPVAARFVEPLSGAALAAGDGPAIFIDQCVRMDDFPATADNDNFADFDARDLRTYQVALCLAAKRDAAK